jgi:putative DNA primase/helicase
MNANFLGKNRSGCPLCGGKDRFRFDDKDGHGSYFCNQCGSGDGFMLAQKFTGRPFAVIADMVRNLFQEPIPEGKTKLTRREDRQHTYDRIWNAAQRPSEGGPLHAYQTNRFGRPWPSNAIREAIQFKHLESNSVCAAQIARITDATGQLVNLHVTYLTKDGKKADVTPQKRVLSGKLPEGSAIRIWPAARIMGIAEGIETAIAAAVLFRMPVWAAINGSLLAKWNPPEQAEIIHIFGDNDENFTGQAKAYELAHKIKLLGKHEVHVKIPPHAGWDWNDVMLDKLKAHQESEIQSSQAVTMES